MAIARALPFEYLIRGAALEYLHGTMHAQAIEQRDAELEDYLATIDTGGVGGSPGVTDHGALTGLTDDDHPMYLIGVAKATEPTAADYGLATIPVGAVWIQTP
jgi:hypothetical protein